MAIDSTNTIQKVESVAEILVRDPFWPVGFYPLAETEKQDDEKKQMQVDRLQELIKWPKLELKGITRTSDNHYIAILDKIGLVEEGDIISVQKDGLIYRWRINTVTDKGISRTQLSAKEINKPLQKQ